MHKLGSRITLPPPYGGDYTRHGTVTEIHPDFIVVQIEGRMGTYQESINVKSDVSKPLTLADAIRDAAAISATRERAKVLGRELARKRKERGFDYGQ